MATGGLYGNSPIGSIVAQPGSESSGLYGNTTNFGGTYFEWFIFQVSEAQPATPTGGSWNFVTNVGTPPTGWLANPPATPTTTVWGSIGLVNSKTNTAIAWSAAGKFSYASGLPIIYGAGVPNSVIGQNAQIYIQTDINPQGIWFKETTTWVALTSSNLYVDAINNQTIAGIKTFSSPIVSSAASLTNFPTFNQNTTGTSSNVTGVVTITHGGTGTTTPALIAGSNVTITGSWPNQTINSTASVSGGGTVTSVALSAPAFLSVSGSPITASGTLALSYSGTALPVVNGGTGVTTSTGTGAVVLSTNPTLTTPTLAGATLSGNIAGGGNQLNNVIIGASTPLAGNFTTLNATGTIAGGDTITSTNATSAQIRAVRGTQTVVIGADGFTSAYVGSTSAHDVSVIRGGSVIGTFSTTGLAVTGAISATGSATAASFSGAGTGLTGTASSLTAGNATTATNVAYSGLTGTVPTWNQSTTGNAANVTGLVAIANGGTGTTTPALVAGSNVTITGAWPNQTINSTAAGGGGGTVTSVNVSGGTTGLTTSGGPVTTSGTITLAGTLVITNGGTGVTTSTGTGSTVLNTSPLLVTPTLSGATVDNSAPYLNYTPTTLPSYLAGRTFYDSALDSLAYYNNVTGNEVLIGQHTQLLVRNETGSTINLGSACYISGRSGSTPLIRLAKADSATTAGAIGFSSVDILNNTNGYLVILGPMYNLNTSGFSPGSTLYLSAATAGAFTDIKPVSPNIVVRVGFSLYNNVSVGSLFASFRPVSTQTSDLIGSVAIANGGSGQTTAQAAINTFAGAVTNSQYLRGNGTNVVMSAIQAADVPTLNQSTTGNAATATLAATATNVAYSGLTGTVPTWNQNTTGTAANVTGTVAVANGGTGATTLAGASIATYTGTETLTNKRIDPRVVSTASASSVTPTVASGDIYSFTALAATLTINAPTGTPVDGDKLIFRILDNGTSRALSWDTTYTIIGTVLPAATTANKMLYVGCIYNSANTRWDVIAVTTQV